MSWLISGFVAVLSGVAGLFLAGFIANACLSWYRVSSREGASGYFVMYPGILGGMAGLMIGFITARIIASSFGPSIWMELVGALGVVLQIAGVSALLCRVLADVAPKMDGREMSMSGRVSPRCRRIRSLVEPE